MTIGALFAGNYFGEEIAQAAEELFNIPQWTSAVNDENDPSLWMVADDNGGTFRKVLKYKIFQAR